MWLKSKTFVSETPVEIANRLQLRFIQKLGERDTKSFDDETSALLAESSDGNCITSTQYKNLYKYILV